MKNVLVFFGGKSCEHDVSVITGVLTVEAARALTARYEANKLALDEAMTRWADAEEALSALEASLR